MADTYNPLQGRGMLKKSLLPPDPMDQFDLTKLFNFDRETGPSGWDKMLGYSNEDGFQPGFGGMALKTFGGLASVYLGMKEYGLAKDTFKQNRREFNMNYDAQRQMTNTELRDRQNSRVQSGNPGYQSVSEYMGENAIAARKG